MFFFNIYQNLTFSAGILFFLDFCGNNNVSDKNNLLGFIFSQLHLTKVMTEDLAGSLSSPAPR